MQQLEKAFGLIDELVSVDALRLSLRATFVTLWLVAFSAGATIAVTARHDADGLGHKAMAEPAHEQLRKLLLFFLE